MASRRRKTTSPKRSKTPRAARSRTLSVVELQKQVAALSRELSQARQQQTASSEVLQIISSSPGELTQVFQAMLAKAVRICEAQFGGLFPCEGNIFRLVAVQIWPARVAEFMQQVHRKPAIAQSMEIVGTWKFSTYVGSNSADPDPRALSS
jgi:hypothetical protein